MLYMSKRWSVGEPTNVYEYLKRKNNEIKVGDTIEYVSNNQQGWVLYKVVLNDEGEKSLDKISDYDSMMYGSDDEDSVGSSKSKGGRKRYKKKSLRKKYSRRNKSRKNKSRRGRKK